jgi:hypothetical protein
MRTLERYEAAVESRNVDLFKSLYPTMTGDMERGLRKAFAGYREVKVDLSDCVITPTGATATATCRERNHVRLAVGSPIDATFDTRFTLRLIGQSWWIVDWSKPQRPR